jgi:hypothetical protein
LQSGDLAGAQQAFATLRGSAEKQASGNVNNGLITAPPTTGPTSPGPDIILNLTGGSGTSVNNGLITAPSSTASSPASSSTGPEIILNLGGGGGSSTNPEQITINLTQTSGGGEQVALSVGSQGSTPQQVTFNLGANSNEQIVLNLLGASSSTPSSTSTAAAGSTSSAASGGLSVTA